MSQPTPFLEIKQLPLASGVKEDLQTLYEAIQEIGYTEFAVLKLLGKLSGYLDELRRLANQQQGQVNPEGQYLLHDLRERTKDIEESQEEVQERIRTLSDGVENVLADIKSLLGRERCSDCMSSIAANSHILVQAAKQVLAQNGYDPETGVQDSQINRDWKSFKKKLVDFAWSLFFAGLSSLAVWSYTEYQKRQQNVALQEVVDHLNKEITSLKNQTNQNPSKPERP